MIIFGLEKIYSEKKVKIFVELHYTEIIVMLL